MNSDEGLEIVIFQDETGQENDEAPGRCFCVLRCLRLFNQHTLHRFGAAGAFAVESGTRDMLD